MTSADPIAHIAVHGLQLTYSAREAAVPLGRSYSWLDQRLRKGDFILPDGMIMQPLRTAGGTGGSLWRCSKTSPQPAIEATGSRWANCSPSTASCL